MKNEYRFYHGKSMKGTFHIGDRLKLETIPFNDLQPGDIVVFRRLNREGLNEDLVHRIIRKNGSVLITRGDNNPAYDHAPLTAQNFIGRISEYEHKRKIHKVNAGSWGLLQARLRHGRLFVKSILKRILCKPYRWVRRKGIVGKIWHPRLMEIQFQTKGGNLVKFIHKKKTVACYWSEKNYLSCCKPYDLILVPAILKREYTEESPKQEKS